MVSFNTNFSQYMCKMILCFRDSYFNTEVVVQSGSPGVSALVYDIPIRVVNKLVILILKETPRLFVAYGKDLIEERFQTEHL